MQNNQLNENSASPDIKEEDYALLKELTVDKERIIKARIFGIQNGIINFCKNYAMFQNKENFFNLTIKEQFEFNECVEYSGNKIKKDLKEMENFYVTCKNHCIAKYHFKSEDIQNNIDEYNAAISWIVRPRLHPCIKDCIELYHYTTEKYYNYMIKDVGIYTELIDYTKYLN